MNLRNLAISNGQTTYKAANPCKRGHTSERYTCNGMCVACLKFYADERKANLKKHRVERNTNLMSGLREAKGIWTPLKHHPELNNYATILRYGDDALIEQCETFLAAMRATIPLLRGTK